VESWHIANNIEYLESGWRNGQASRATCTRIMAPWGKYITIERNTDPKSKVDHDHQAASRVFRGNRRDDLRGDSERQKPPVYLPQEGHAYKDQRVSVSGSAQRVP
jgi:hypothetical protein